MMAYFYIALSMGFCIVVILILSESKHLVTGFIDDNKCLFGLHSDTDDEIFWDNFYSFAALFYQA